MFDDVQLSAIEIENRDKAMAALEMAYPKGPPSTMFQSFQVSGLRQGDVFFLMVTTERRRWSRLHHLEVRIMLGELDKVDLAIAGTVAGALRGGIMVWENPPNFVFYRESWPLINLEPDDVVNGGQALGFSAGLYRSALQS